MSIKRIILLLSLFGIANASGSADPPAELPQLLEELDHAGLVQDMPGVAALITKWKRLEPTAAAPWLKEMALLQMTATADSEGCIDVLRKGLKALPTNKTLRARLAGACAVNGRPQEALKHYRWLFENAGGMHEKLSWVIQMKLVENSAEEVRRWFLWQRVAHPEDATPLIYASEDASSYPDPKLEERLRRSSGAEPELKELRRGRQALQMRHFPEAVEVLKALVNEHPSTGNRLQLVRALIYGGLHEQALGLLQEIRERKDLTGPEIENVAAFYFEECLWEQAVLFLAPHCTAEPENYRYAFLMACALEESGDHAGAREAFLKLVSIRRDTVPGDPPHLAIYPMNGFDGDRRVFHAPSTCNLKDAWLPAEAMRVRWYVSSYETWVAYGYVRRENANFSYVNQSMVSRYNGELMVPGTLEEAFRWALQHLTALWCELPPEQRGPMEAALWKCGIPAKVLLRHFAPGRPELDGAIGAGFGWECDAMSPEGSAATQAFIQEGTWETYRAAYNIFEKSHPDLASRAALKLGSDPNSQDIYLKAAQLNPPKSNDTPFVPKERQPIKESIRAFPGLPAKNPPEVKVVEPVLEDVEWKRPDAMDQPDRLLEKLSGCFLTGQVSDEFWSAYQQDCLARVQFVSMMKTDFPALQVEKNRDLVKARIRQMSEITPRAIVEKAMAFLMLKDEPSAFGVFDNALKSKPRDRTLQICALANCWSTESRKQQIGNWGFGPFLNRFELYYLLPNEQDARTTWKFFDERITAFLHDLPDWQLELNDFGWLRNNEEGSPALWQEAMRIPSLARHAFQRIASDHDAAGKPLSELAPWAEKALLASVRTPRQALSEMPRDGLPDPKPQKPEEVLLRQALLDQSPDLLDKLIFQMLGQDSQSGIRSGQYLQLTRDLHFGDEANLPAILRRLLRGDGSRGWIAEVAAARAKDLNFPALVSSEIRNLPLTYVIRDEYGSFKLTRLNSAFTEQTEWTYLHKGPEAAGQFFEPITSLCLGEKATRRKLLRGRSHQGMAAWLGYIGSSGSENPAYCKWLLDQFREEFAGVLSEKDTAWAWDQLAANREYFPNMSGTLQAYGWLGTPAQFDPLFSPDPKARSQFSQFFKDLKSPWKGERGRNLWEEEPVKAAKSFGRALLGLDPWPRPLIVCYDQFLPEIENLPQQQQKGLARLFLELGGIPAGNVRAWCTKQTRQDKALEKNLGKLQPWLEKMDPP